MARITEFAPDLRRGRQGFLRTHQGFFLWREGAGSGDSDGAAHTDRAPGIAFRTGYMTLGQSESHQTDYEVMPIRKGDSSVFSDRISLGRAPNCDIVLRLPYISKLHAHFSTRSDGTLQIADAGSANGTSVNGRLLRPGEAMTLQVRDTLRFGSINFILADAGTLFDALSPDVAAAQ